MRFLVAYDDTDGARAALAAVVPLARAASAEILLLHVINPLIDAADVIAPNTREAVATVVAREQQRMEDSISALGIPAEIHVEQLTHGEDDWEHIVHFAQDARVDLIAIGSRRAGGLAGAILGSVVRAVVQHSHCPVLVVRPENRPAE